MKTATLLPDVLPVAAGRWVDYVALAKPRVAILVLFTVGAGVLFASLPEVPVALLCHAVIGTALVATGASALNQWIERDSDGHMKRTRGRPLPSGRLSPAEVFAFGVLCGLAGTLYLLLLLPSPCAAGVAGFTFLAYVCVYTPMKRLTSLNTLVGAIPGAMPPIIGWCAVRGEVTAEALTLFVILFLWQVPHFLAIAWMYRDEYAQAGLVMLPVIDPQGTSTARQMILYSLALVATSLAPVFLGSAGLLYLVGAVLLGSHFTLSAVRFQTRRSHSQAKQVLRASLVYLPGLLVALIVDRSVIILW